MNVIELLVFMILSAGLLELGHVLSRVAGTAGWLVGVVPVSLFWAWVMFEWIRGAIMYTGHVLSSRPICRQGKCRQRDYDLIDWTPSKATFRCRCGDIYLSKDGRFSQILQDNSVLPYMMRDSAQSWKTDTGEALN